MGFKNVILSIGGAAFSVGAGVAMSYGPDAYPEYTKHFFWFGIVIMTLALSMIATAYWRYRNQTTESDGGTMGNDFSIKTGNITGDGNQIGHVIHQGKPQRKLNDAFRAQVLREMPRDKPISVTGLIGDQESINLANEIFTYLERSGFKLAADSIYTGMYNPTPRGVRVNNTESEICIMVGIPE